MTDLGSRVNQGGFGGGLAAPTPPNRTRTSRNSKDLKVEKPVMNTATVEDNTKIELPVKNNQRRVPTRDKPTVKLGLLGKGEAGGRYSPTNANRLVSQNVSNSLNKEFTEIEESEQNDQAKVKVESLNSEVPPQEADPNAKTETEDQTLTNGRKVTTSELEQFKEFKNVEIKRVELPAENKLPLLGTSGGQRRPTARQLISAKKKSESDNSVQRNSQIEETSFLEVGEGKVGQESIDSRRVLLEQAGSEIDLLGLSAQRRPSRGSQVIMEKKIEEINMLAGRSISPGQQQTVVQTETMQTEGGQRTVTETHEKTTVHHELEPSKALPLKGAGPRVFNRAVRLVKPAEHSAGDVSDNQKEVMSQLTLNAGAVTESYDTRTTDGLQSINLTYSDETQKRASEGERNSDLTSQSVSEQRNTTLTEQTIVETRIEKVRLTGLDGGPLPIKGGQRKFNRPVLTAKSNGTQSDTFGDNQHATENDASEGEGTTPETLDLVAEKERTIGPENSQEMLQQTEHEKAAGDSNADVLIYEFPSRESPKETITQTVENNQFVRIATGETKEDTTNTPVILRQSGEAQMIQFLEQQAEAETKGSVEGGQRIAVKAQTEVIESEAPRISTEKSLQEAVAHRESAEAVHFAGTETRQTTESEQRQSAFIRKEIVTVTKTYTMQDKDVGELPILHGGRKFNRPNFSGNKAALGTAGQEAKTEITGENGDVAQEVYEEGESQQFESGDEESDAVPLLKDQQGQITAKVSNLQQTQKSTENAFDTAANVNTVKSAEPALQKQPLSKPKIAEQVSSSTPVAPLLPSVPISPLDENLSANQHLPSLGSEEAKTAVQPAPQTNLRIKELQAKIQASNKQRQEPKETTQTAAIQSLSRTAKSPNSVEGQGGFAEGGSESSEAQIPENHQKQITELKRRFMNSFESRSNFEAEKIVLPANRESRSGSVVTAEQQIKLINTEVKTVTESAKKSGENAIFGGTLGGIREEEEAAKEDVFVSKAVDSRPVNEQQSLTEQQLKGAPLASAISVKDGNAKISVDKGVPVTAHELHSEVQGYGQIFSANFAPSLVKPERISDSYSGIDHSIQNDFEEPFEHSAVEAVSMQGTLGRGNLDSLKPQSSVASSSNSQTNANARASTENSLRPKLIANQQAQKVTISVGEKMPAVKDSASGRQSSGASQKQSVNATNNRQSVHGNQAANRSSLVSEAPITPAKQGSVTPVSVVNKGSVSVKKQPSLISNNVRDSKVETAAVFGSQTSVSKRSVKDSANPTQSTAKASTATRQSANDKSGRIRDKSVEGFLGDRGSLSGVRAANGSAVSKKLVSGVNSRSGSFKSSQNGSSSSISKEQPANVKVAGKQAQTTAVVRPVSRIQQKRLSNTTERAETPTEVLLTDQVPDFETDRNSEFKTHSKTTTVSAKANLETVITSTNTSANEIKIPSEKHIDDDKRSSMSKEGDALGLGLTGIMQAKGLPTSVRTYQLEQISAPITRVEYGEQRVVFRGEPIVKSVVQNTIYPTEEEAKMLNHRCCDLPKVEEAISHFMASITGLAIQTQVNAQTVSQTVSKMTVQETHQAMRAAQSDLLGVYEVQKVRVETRSISPQTNVHQVVQSSPPPAYHTVSGAQLRTVAHQLTYPVNSPITRIQAVTFTNAVRPVQQSIPQSLPITQTKLIKMSVPAQMTNLKTASPTPVFTTVEPQFRIDSRSPKTYRRTIFTKTIAQEIGQPKIQTIGLSKAAPVQLASAVIQKQVQAPLMTVLPVQSQTRVLSPVPIAQAQPVIIQAPKVDYHQSIAELQSINTAVTEIDQQFARLAKREAESRQQGVSEAGETELTVILRQKQSISMQFNAYVQRYYYIIWTLQTVKCTCEQHHILKVEPLSQGQLNHDQASVTARNSKFVNAIQRAEKVFQTQNSDASGSNSAFQQQSTVADFSLSAQPQVTYQHRMQAPVQVHAHSPFIQLGFHQTTKQHAAKTLSELEEEWFISQKGKDLFTLETAHALREQTFITQIMAEIYSKCSEKHAKVEYEKRRIKAVGSPQNQTVDNTYGAEKIREVSSYHQALKQLAFQNTIFIVRQVSLLLGNKSGDSTTKNADPMVKIAPFFGSKSHLAKPLSAETDPTSQSRQ